MISFPCMPPIDACLDTVGTQDKIAFVDAKIRPLELIPFTPHSPAMTRVRLKVLA